MRKTIKILIALDSIIYAPLYVFVQRNSLDKSCPFLFQIEPVHDKIILENDEYPALSPIEYDPVFSPLANRDGFQNNNGAWFGVADPLRMVRLYRHYEKINKINSLGFKYTGTFISKPAFWFLGDIHLDKIWNYNYITCHSKGMTGYYIAEYISCLPNLNYPLAPIRYPGTEVEFFHNILSFDKHRRINGDKLDMVHFGTITTEIGKVNYFKSKLNYKSPKYNFWFLPEDINSSRLRLPQHMLMTGIISRMYDKKQDEDAFKKNRLIYNASIHLIEGIKKAIVDLEDPNKHKIFIRDLKNFYSSRASFKRPCNPYPLGLNFHLKETVQELSIRKIYTHDALRGKLRVDERAIDGTLDILNNILDSELIGDVSTEVQNDIDFIIDKNNWIRIFKNYLRD